METKLTVSCDIVAEVLHSSIAKLCQFYEVSMPKVITRKSVPKDESTRLKIVQYYTNGHPIEEIASQTGWTEKSIKREINLFFRSLKDVIETEALIESQKADKGSSVAKSKAAVQLYRNQQKIDKDINEKFISKLSSPEEEIITQEEVLFCYLLVHEGDEIKALTDSGLAEGLAKSGTGYKRAMKLRCLMLKGKRNLIKYINDLQINYAKDLNIGKEAVQSMLLKQIYQLTAQNDPRLAPTIAKLTQDLGRTVGAFSDKVIIEEVSFDDAMDHMLEMRKEKKKEVVESLPEGSSGVCRIPDKENCEPGGEVSTFVYDPEKIG